MTIPDYETIMLPLLAYLSDGAERSLDEAVRHITKRFGLTEEEQLRRIPSGQSTYIKNRVGWARTYLKRAGLINSPKRGVIEITDPGREALAGKPERIDQKYLRRYPDFVQFIEKSGLEKTGQTTTEDAKVDQTPEESFASSYEKVRAQLADDILDTVKSCSPAFFEKLVIDLLVAMGYGGSTADAAQATRYSKDEGVDGIIKEDKLGLDTIYVQAKRWENPVHRPEVQKFAGALQGKRSKKGIFITTSTFSDGAKEFARSIDSHIVFIDGYRLAELMIDHGVGVTTQKVYELKKVDSDYFSKTVEVAFILLPLTKELAPLRSLGSKVWPMFTPAVTMSKLTFTQRALEAIKANSEADVCYWNTTFRGRRNGHFGLKCG